MVESIDSINLRTMTDASVVAHYARPWGLSPAEEATFALNALSFLVVIVALLFWKREAPRATLPSEHFLSAIRAEGGRPGRVSTRKAR